MSNNKPQCVDVVGLRIGSDGRTCESHDVCGEHIRVDDILLVKKCVVEIKGVPEGALGVHKISNGQTTCRIGFISRNAISRVPENNVLQVLQLYDK